jgi:hypothetical protein
MTTGIQENLTFAPPSDFERTGFDGPFLFCDYWASVLGLKDIVNPHSLSAVGLSLEIYRKILNRPSAGLPKLGYFILSTLLQPLVLLWRGLLRLAGKKRESAPPPYKQDAMRNMLLKHALNVEPTGGGDACVRSDGEVIASKVLNPFRLRAKASMFFARYKVFLGSAVALGYGALVVPVASLFGAENVVVPYLGVLFYPIVLLILWVMFDDLLTATVAPLPLIAITRIVRISQGFKGFVIAVVGLALVIYLVEWFFIPRSLPPALHFYVNDPKSRLFPYRRGQEPYWLKGKFYWVWRFVNLAPAELIKFWEKDWERLEVWVRADGEEKGRIEWIVSDWHYRELWFTYESFIRSRAQQANRTILDRVLNSDERLTWVVETDMDLVFHSPVVRGIHLTRGRHLSFGRRLVSIFLAIVRKRAKDRPDRYSQNLELFEMRGGRFLEDMPEHFRMAAARKLLSMPWSYWRFPHGANTSKKFFVYGGTSDLNPEAQLASDPKFQIKEPG